MSAAKLQKVSEENGQDGSPKKMMDVAFEVKLSSTNSLKKNLLASSKGVK